MSVSKIVAAAASSAGGAGLDVDEVFSTFLYDGNNTGQSIVNAIDLSGEGGMVWTKSRAYAVDHALVDTVRGNTKYLQSHNTSAEASSSVGITAFNNNGYTLGADNTWIWNVSNSYVKEYVSWTFRKAKKFFDVVKYTGTGAANRSIGHSLGSRPGMILIKGLDTTFSWNVFHRSLPIETGDFPYILQLDKTDAQVGGQTYYESGVTSTHFQIMSYNAVNQTGKEYVAYLFAHNDDDGEFGPDGNADIIKCGSYTGNTSTRPSIDLGFEPQFLMIKRTDSADNWYILDTMRGIVTSAGNDTYLYANTSGAEATVSEVLKVTATGFELEDDFGGWNASGGNYIYMAIRRGPLAVPDDATKVFSVLTGDGNGDSTTPQFASGFPVDTALIRSATGTANNNLYSRLTANKYLSTNSTAAEVTDATDFSFAANTGWYLGSTTWTSWMWKRAKGFFDVLAYSGNGSNRTITHNLGAVPEMMWIKSRSNASHWQVYHSALGNTKYIELNNTSLANTNSARWNDTTPTSSVFTLGTDDSVNDASRTYIAYLFASIEGVSKVGSYTGDGTTDGSKVINCGFAPRFILIKKAINGTGNWRYYDTHRGIVAGGDAALLLNQTDAQNSSADSIDPHATGFTVIDGNTNSNTDGYIFYAIA